MFIISILILWLLIKLEAPVIFIILGCLSVTTELVYTINDIIVTIIMLIAENNENE